MADFPTIESPSRGDQPDVTDLFDSGQVDNIIIGINTAKDGALQALEETKEFLGLVPTGSSEFLTEQMKKDQLILKGANADDQKLTGAGGFEFAGEVLPLLTVPLGGTVRGAAGLGAATGAGFFQEDVTESRLDDIATGAVFGGVFKRLLMGGRALKGAQDGIAEFEQKLLPPPPQRVGQKALTDQRQLALPRPAPRAGTADASLKNRGFTADDFQNAGKNPIPGFQGVPKPRVRVPLTPAQRAVATTGRANPKAAEKAMRKLQVLRNNAVRKMERLAEKLPSVKKPHLVAKLRNQITDARKTKVAASVMLRSIAKAKQVGFDTLKPAIPKPRVQVGSGTTSATAAGKPSIAGPAANAVDVKPLTRKEAIKEIVAANPNAKGLGKMNVKELREVVEQLRGARAGGPGGRQGGFSESNLVNTLAGAGVGGAIGGAVSDGDPLAIAAFALTGGLGVRVAGKALDSVTTNKMRQGMREASKAGGQYTAKVSRAVKAKDIAGDTVSSIVTGAGEVMNKFLGATMTRIQAISPRVATALAEAEYLQHFRANDMLNQGDQVFQRISAANLTDPQARRLKIALLNSTKQARAYLRSIGKEDAALAVAEMDTILADAGRYLKEVGLGNNLRANYFPRLVQDAEQLGKDADIKTYLDQLAHKKGIKLTDFEEQAAITNLINGALVRGNEGLAFARASSNLKRRGLKVDNSTVDAYADPHQTFNDYVESITTQVERRRFFEGQGVNTAELGPNAENLDSIARKLSTGLVKGDLTKEQADEVAMLLRMRFGPGEQAPHQAVQNFKNLTYAGLLGNPLAAMTQIGDMALSAHRNGLRNTVSSAMETLANRGRGARGLDKQELLGIRNAATDFASKVKTRDALNWTLRAGLFQQADALGKNTFIGAAMKKNKQLSPEDFKGKWRGIFDPEAAPGAPTPRTDALFQKVQKFEEITPENREDIGFMLWNDLSGVQPIAISAMPEAYLANPNVGRMSYMLQSFTLKLFDVMKKDVINNVAAGNHALAAKNMTRLSSYFVLTNSSVEMAKNWILQKDAAIPDVVLNNTLKMFGANKFMFDQIGTTGLGSTFVGQVTPPTALLDAVIDPKKALGLVPISGRIIESRIE